jgi:hypothetical protein
MKTITQKIKIKSTLILCFLLILPFVGLAQAQEMPFMTDMFGN